MSLTIFPTPLAGLCHVQTSAHQDGRGAFARFFCSDELRPLLGDRRIVQINHSLTREVGTVRGMHYQRAPHAEMKLVRCLRGRVFDVAVDLRRGSATLLRWHALVLAPDASNMLVIPEGFAHGFQVLEPDSELLYLHTARYEPAAEGGVAYADARLAIAWPLPPRGLSARDSAFAPLPEGFPGLEL